ncbi:MAG: hypothetical protein SYC29_06575 [Planctomycetota bacterium]|nr:hypothetical protein [Planctomycetota bacterium]
MSLEKITMHYLRRYDLLAMAGATLLVLGGCAARYATPSRGADMSLFGGEKAKLQQFTDRKVQVALDRKPTARFPVTLAVVRVQEAGYRSRTARGYGSGEYSVVTTRDIEEDEDFKAINDLDRISGVATVNRLLLPARLSDDRELRAAAAAVHADMLLLYTLDTAFTTEDGMRPLTVLTLGLFPTKNVRVNSTASALLLDTRTGYVYGVAEASAEGAQLANAWTSGDAADQARRRIEREAFGRLVGRFEHAWADVVAIHDRHAGP